jgi:hypothetical protein
MICSVVSCASGVGIANQSDLWEAIRLPHVKVYRSAITDIAASNGEVATSPSKSVVVHLADRTCVDPVDLVIHATGYKPIVPIRFEPSCLRLELGLSALVEQDDQNLNEKGQISTGSPEKINGPLEPSIQDRIKYWETLDQRWESRVRENLNATKCALADRSSLSWTASDKLVPYRLFRRMVSPELVAQGDRSFATLGVILSSTIAIVAEVQALWVAAFLTGGLDTESMKSTPDEALCLTTLSKENMENATSEDIVLGSLTGSGLEVDAIQVCLLKGIAEHTLTILPV